MKAGIFGFPGSGRETIFRSLTGLKPAPPSEVRQGEALVEDLRLNYLSDIFKPKKHTPARLEFFLPKPMAQGPKEALKASLEKLRETDALLMVLDNFSPQGENKTNPAKEAQKLLEELLLSDYLIVQKRLERLAEERKRGKKNDPEEFELLGKANGLLENNQPLRGDSEIANSAKLRGFGFLSAKPLLVILNNPENGDENLHLDLPLKQLILKGLLEEEFSQLDPVEAKDFMADYGLTELGVNKVIKTVYEIMDLISFFTVGEDECRAWTITRGEDALSAAGRIHSDIQKGFIRAEVVAYDDFKTAGGFNEAKKKGLFRLEGKTYQVVDGDIVHFRFNV